MSAGNLTQYLGIPYLNQGRTRQGLDCWGLILLAYKELQGIDLYDPGIDYPVDWAMRGADHLIENHAHDWMRVYRPRPFDIAAFKNLAGIVNHVGIVTDVRSFIHCPKAGVVVCRLGDRPWSDRLSGFYRNRRLP